MTKPVRIQLSRKKGFNLQEYSKSINGLEAIKCDRSSKWGNPFNIVSNKNSFGILKGGTLELLKYGTTNQEAIKRSIDYFERFIKENERRLDKILHDDEVNPNYLNYSKEKYAVFDVDNKFCYFRNGYEWMRLTSYFINFFLKNKNLACWCKKNESCHCDVLLRIANED